MCKKGSHGIVGEIEAALNLPTRGSSFFFLFFLITLLDLDIRMDVARKIEALMRTVPAVQNIILNLHGKADNDKIEDYMWTNFCFAQNKIEEVVFPFSFGMLFFSVFLFNFM